MEAVVFSTNVFKTFQVNGQRITVNNILNDESEGHEVFIGHLPRDMYESELLPVLMSVGQLSELRIMMNFSGNNRGFAFARYANKESAENAVKHLNHFEIRVGRKMVVIESRDKKRLFIGRFPVHMKEDTIAQILQSVTENIVKIETRFYAKNGAIRHYCIVDYKSHMDACKARRALVLTGREVFHCDVIVDWAFVEKDEGVAEKDVQFNESSKALIKEKLNDKNSTELKKGKKNRQFSSRTSTVYTSWNETGVYSQCKPLQTTQQMNIGILKATVMECQLCGPSCSFNKGHSKTVRAGRFV